MKDFLDFSINENFKLDELFEYIDSFYSDFSKIVLKSEILSLFLFPDFHI